MVEPTRPVPLPIDAALPELVAALVRRRAAVLVAPPGAGKTTRVPPALAASGLAAGGRVVVLEPRRLAARVAARRVAEEQGWRLGGEVGYQVRFERRAGTSTRILFVTEGILVQRLQADPFLTGVGAVVFDELHERSLHTDLALAMARQVQRQARPELALLAMSATLDAGPVADFLGGCPVVDCPGRRFPLEVRYLERSDPRPLPLAMAAGVERGLAGGRGDLLVFLPGVGEIERTRERLAPGAERAGIDLVTLYGDLPPERQDAALLPSPRRKVVLATNVAETSITVAGVSTVVDSGLVRRLRYDAASGLDRLALERVSRASAEQRAGRAGREGPGLCLRLWPEWEQAGLAEREPPEIGRVDLAAPALQLLAWGERDLTAFGWLEAPEPAALGAALELLRRLGAVGRQGVTTLGREMARLPVHPRLACLLLAGRRLGRLPESALAAALLSERDPFPRSGRPEAAGGGESAGPGGLLERIEALEALERDRDRRRSRGASAAAGRVLAARDQLLSLAAGLGASAPDPPDAPPAQREEALGRALLAAFPDRLARRREPGARRALMVGGRGVRLVDPATAAGAELFVAIVLADVAPGRPDPHAEALVRLAAPVEAAWLPAERLETRVELELDSARARVVAWRRTRCEDLLLAESEVPPPDPAAVERLLVEAARRDLGRALALDDPAVASFLARVSCLAEWMPELGLPTFDAAALAALLPALAAGRRSFADLRRAPLLPLLEAGLDPDQRRALAREAPERLAVPSGSRVRIAYEPGKPPVLAVRIQELFGLAETPRIAAGRVPVLLHLLAPNQRPQQVTQDLASFWRSTYPEVRRELAGRYPRHAWPADPTRALPERNPRRTTSRER